MENLSVIIVEDDPLIAFDLKEILLSQSDIDSVEIFNSPQAIFDWNGENLDLAFLDINLNSSFTGVDIANFLQKKFNSKHLFITSYFDKKTIEIASQTNPLAYILKPYQEEEVIANFLLAKQKIYNNTEGFIRPSTEEKSLGNVFIKTSQGIKKMDLNQILFIEAVDIYSKIITKDEKIMSSMSLKNIESSFDLNIFFRVHRSFIVNINAIQLIQDNEIKINEFSIPIGRTYKKQFLEFLNVY